MLTVHHLNLSRSTRVLWMLEELGLPYEIVGYQRGADYLAPPGLKRIHPLGKSPVLTDGDQTLAESGAILEYLAERYGAGKLVPAEGTPERLRYRYWLHYAEGSLMPLMVMKLIVGRIPKAPMPFFARPIARGIAKGVETGYLGPNLKTHLAFVESELGSRPYFAGNEFTAADIQMSFPLEAAQSRAGADAQSTPHIAAFVEKIHARPAYQRAVEKGGPTSR